MNIVPYLVAGLLFDPLVLVGTAGQLAEKNKTERKEKEKKR